MRMSKRIVKNTKKNLQFNFTQPRFGGVFVGANMGNSNSEHSKRLRQETARAREKEVIAAGGWRLTLLLSPEVAAILRAEIARTAGTATGIVSELIRSLKDR
jgi:hypothetical protein